MSLGGIYRPAVEKRACIRAAKTDRLAARGEFGGFHSRPASLILVLAVLVGIFVSIRKHSPSPRNHLWMLAWTLVFLHFLVQVFEVHTGLVEGLIESVEVGALEIAGVLFAISMSITAEDSHLRRVLSGVLIVPLALYTIGATLEWRAHWIWPACWRRYLLWGSPFRFMPTAGPRYFTYVSRWYWRAPAYGRWPRNCGGNPIPARRAC